MTDFERFAQALALTETRDDEKSWGDQGLAVGRWQMHPAFVDEWWPDDIGVDWSWNRLFRAALLRFYGAKAALAVFPINMAMQFHLGEAAAKRGEWDEVYAARFVNYYTQLGKPETA